MRNDRQNKRIYTKPELEVIEVDIEMADNLGNISDNSGPGGLSTGNTYKLSSESTGVTLKSTTAEEVFGGNSVDYGD